MESESQFPPEMIPHYELMKAIKIEEAGMADRENEGPDTSLWAKRLETFVDILTEVWDHFSEKQQNEMIKVGAMLYGEMLEHWRSCAFKIDMMSHPNEFLRMNARRDMECFLTGEVR